MNTCKNCGGTLIGDGYRTVVHCEYAEIDFDLAPDEGPVYCEGEEE